MKRVALVLALVLALAAGAAAALDASLSAPGGLSPDNTPQFVLFTHDDGIIENTHAAMLSVTDGVTANGCPAAATMFTTYKPAPQIVTDCELLSDLFYNKGYEIADHTMTHKSFLNQTKASLREEIVGVRDWIADNCGIPKEDIVGLRAPYLEIKGEVWEVLAENGFLYDSTLIEEGTGKSLTRGMGSRVWPFTMDKGVPINCDWFGGIQKCNPKLRLPLWEIPVWNLAAERKSYTMDYGDDCALDGDNCLYRILKKNFDASYEGNRAPFPIFIHTPWLLNGTNAQQLRQFVEEVAAKKDVYLITMRQLIAWMQNPVGAAELTPEQLGCGNPGGAGPSAAAAAGGAAGDQAAGWTGAEEGADSEMQWSEEEGAAAAQEDDWDWLDPGAWDLGGGSEEEQWAEEQDWSAEYKQADGGNGRRGGKKNGRKKKDRQNGRN